MKSVHRKQRVRPQSTRQLLFEQLSARLPLAADTLLPLGGDFNGDGADSVGLYNTTTHQFSLRNENSSGRADLAFQNPGLQATGMPVIGDWNGDGRDTVGLYESACRSFVLANENSASSNLSVVNLSLAPATNNAIPLAGDWNGDGLDTVALYDPTQYKFYLQTPQGTATAMAWKDAPSGSLIANDFVPLAGDFTGSGHDSIALLQRSTGRIYVGTVEAKPQYKILNSSLPSDATSTPLVGNWNGAGTSETGVFQAGSLSFALYQDLIANTTPNTITVSATLDTSPNAINFVPVKTATAKSAAMPVVPKIISADEVSKLLKRAAAASKSEDAIIAVVDRGGRILGVRVEQDIVNAYGANIQKLSFAIDGSVAKARTAASFSSDQAPLTSRTVRFISQSTITEREVNSNPNFRDPINYPNPYDSPILGPGFVAPIGLGGHFPPDIANTPPVDLFNIEHQGRDGSIHPGADGLLGMGGDDVLLPGRFNVNPALGSIGSIEPPNSYGYTSGLFLNAQGRGFATLPGGIPLTKISMAMGMSMRSLAASACSSLVPMAMPLTNKTSKSTLEDKPKPPSNA